MECAGHFPTKRFDHAEWLAMPVHVPNPYNFAGDGFHRSNIRGKPIVFYIPPIDSGEVDFVVRPIVRVKMGRRVVGGECHKCGSRGMGRYCSRC